MENELIKIKSDENGNKIVSARELHDFLEIKKYFTQWLETYIKKDNKYGFEENIDFTRITAEVNPTNEIPLIEYALTVDMAKELSMLSKTEKGKKARKYFIKCEKKLKENIQLISAQKEIKELKDTLEDFKRTTKEAKRQFHPCHKRKLDYNKMIKNIVGNNKEYVEGVKDMVFVQLHYDKWEDASTEDNDKIINAINVCSRFIILNKFEQLSLL